MERRASYKTRLTNLPLEEKREVESIIYHTYMQAIYTSDLRRSTVAPRYIPVATVRKEQSCREHVGATYRKSL